MRNKLFMFCWRRGWKRIAYALNPQKAVRLTASELEEQRRRRYWEDG